MFWRFNRCHCNLRPNPYCNTCSFFFLWSLCLLHWEWKKKWWSINSDNEWSCIKIVAYLFHLSLPHIFTIFTESKLGLIKKCIHIRWRVASEQVHVLQFFMEHSKVGMKIEQRIKVFSYYHFRQLNSLLFDLWRPPSQLFPGKKRINKTNHFEDTAQALLHTPLLYVLYLWAWTL